MLFVSVMLAANDQRAIRIFLVGLARVAVGVAVTLLGEIFGTGQGIWGDKPYLVSGHVTVKRNLPIHNSRMSVSADTVFHYNICRISRRLAATLLRIRL